MLIHAYRLVYTDSSHAPPRLWEWEDPYIDMLIQNARTFQREVVQRDFPTWEDLAQENQHTWDTYYAPRAPYEPWDTWQAWIDEYREILRDVQDLAEEHYGRMREDPLQAHQNGQRG